MGPFHLCEPPYPNRLLDLCKPVHSSGKDEAVTLVECQNKVTELEVWAAFIGFVSLEKRGWHEGCN